MIRHSHYSVLLIVIDALRKRNLGIYGYDKPTSPYLDSLAKNGIILDNAYSVTNVTDSSLTSILTGRYPYSHGILSHGQKITKYQLAKILKVPYLPEILRNNGYFTIAIDFLGRWHKRGFYYYGFNINPLYEIMMKGTWTANCILRRLVGRSLFMKYSQPYTARDATNLAIMMLRKHYKKKFFMFIHYWDTHIPYYAPKHYVNIFKKYHSSKEGEKTIKNIAEKIKGPWSSRLKRFFPHETINDVKARYDASIAYVDHEIGRLIATIEDLGIMDNMLIVINKRQLLWNPH